MIREVPVHADETASRCDYYRQFCGLHAEIALEDPERIVLPVGGGMGAVVVPVDFGRGVLARIRWTGPVIEHPRSARWTFLCAPCWVPHDVTEHLARIGVTAVEHGQFVVLPSPADESTRFRLWIQHPGQHQPLPQLSAVLDALRATSTKATFRRWAEEELSWTATSRH